MTKNKNIERTPKLYDCDANHLVLTQFAWELSEEGDFKFSCSYLDKNDKEIKIDSGELDLRYDDVSNIDFRDLPAEVFEQIVFNDNTKWPSADKMPAKEVFDPVAVMKNGKNPGLGVRELHNTGITGKGVGVAIIDQVLNVNDPEYTGNLQCYHEFGIENYVPDLQFVNMHGPGVASIAVGKTVGVAPDAKLYYMAARVYQGDGSAEGIDNFQFFDFANAVNKVLDINEKLSDDEKIRVISMSVGWSEENAGYKEMEAACNKAMESGILFVSSNLSVTHAAGFHTLSTHSMADKDNPNSYVPGEFWQSKFYKDDSDCCSRKADKTILVPSGHRTVSCDSGSGRFVHYQGSGAWSWGIPYVAGVYALACQANPDVTPDEFLQTALETGTEVTTEHKGKGYKLPGKVINPPAIIQAVQKCK